MIKKIKIVNKWGMYIHILRDTTIGNTYSVTSHEEGTVDTCGEVCMHDTICFKDDIGDTAAIWVHSDDIYEVVEED